MTSRDSTTIPATPGERPAERPDPWDLPLLGEVFQELRRGYHICPEDGRLHRVLRRHLDDFTRLFAALGFRLEAHARDFFYFHGTGALSDRSERMAVFLFILIEWLADQGLLVEQELLTRRFPIADLPHLRVERYAACMKEAGLQGEAGIAEVLRALERFGFAERLGQEAFRFRPAVLRFADLCHQVLERADTPPSPVQGEDPAGPQEATP